MKLPNILDNQRIEFLDTFKKIAPDHKRLSVATGYWDIEGMRLVIDSIKDFEKVRILIGREPLLKRDNKNDIDSPEIDYPDQDFFEDLQRIDPSLELKQVVIQMKGLIEEGRLEVKVYRRSFLHAKCYIFGDESSDSAVGIIGSSNFTRNGMTTNYELNALESDVRIVTFEPKSEEQEVGHLFWFNQLWEDELSEDWTGKFIELVRQSPVGDQMPSPYEMYIKTLTNLFQDELTDDIELSEDVEKVLYAFQQRNAQLLINKLEKHSLAMLADSVGLGKTITGGAVIKHYVEEGYKRINIIVPKRLESQWKQELASHHGLVNNFEIIPLENPAKIEESREIDKWANVDLFVIDEAHNLRNAGGKRHQQILDWLANNPKSKVLLMTATPINNQLEDFVHQIQLASKGKIYSFPIVFKSAKGKGEVIDFYEGVRRLSTELKQAEKAGQQPDWERIHKVMRQGLRQFLVRSTRVGIEKEFGGVLGSNGVLQTFPKGKVEPTPYEFSFQRDKEVLEILNSKSQDHFESHNIPALDHDKFLGITQRAQHPLDIIAKTEDLITQVSENQDTFETLFKALLVIGFTPYRSETYKNEFYAKEIDVIKGYDLPDKTRFKIMGQLSIHNMLRVSYLKRLESSPRALQISLKNYKKKISLFRSYLDEGYVLSFKQIHEVEKEQGDDISVLEDDVLEKAKADPEIYNIDALKQDLSRDEKIIDALVEVCENLEKTDDKLKSFVELLNRINQDSLAGNKVLVFSFYADTIAYLKEKLPQMMGDEFVNRAAFVSSSDAKDIDSITKRFAPKAKKASISPEDEIQYLFATDVLSEGQNLQDCGVIVNFDLHWNPVRMIQRNGRINRLGSSYEKVFIYNLHPEARLEAYLRLVKRLEEKVQRINYAIGNDQSVLGEKENPIEYVEDLYKPEKADEVAASLEDDEGLLSEDEYVNDLRSFMKDATEEERLFIKRIPEGKWGLLPPHSVQNPESPTTLALVGVKALSNDKPFKSDIFISSDGAEIASPMELLDALSVVRTQKDESNRDQDTFTHNKPRTKELVEALAKNEAINQQVVRKIKPAQEIILNQLASLLPHLHFQEVLENISTVQDERKWTKLLNKVKNETKENGQPLPQTLASLESAYQDFMSRSDDDKEFQIESVKAQLFYAK